MEKPAEPKKKINELSDKELAKFSKRMAEIYETGYISTKRMALMSFIRGVTYGFGFFIGGTLLVAILAWALGQFNQVPLLDALLKAIQNTAK